MKITLYITSRWLPKKKVSPYWNKINFLLVRLPLLPFLSHLSFWPSSLLLTHRRTFTLYYFQLCSSFILTYLCSLQPLCLVCLEVSKQSVEGISRMSTRNQTSNITGLQIRRWQLREEKNKVLLITTYGVYRSFPSTYSFVLVPSPLSNIFSYVTDTPKNSKFS